MFKLLKKVAKWYAQAYSRLYPYGYYPPTL